MPDFGIMRGFNDKLFGDKLYAGQLPTQLGLIGSVDFAFDPDAQAFFDRVTAATGTLSDTEKLAVDTLVKQMKADGTWTLMKAIYPMVGASAAACKQNLKSASFEGSFTSGWTFASTGVTPNGSSAFMNTGLNIGTVLTQTNSHASFYSRTASDTAGSGGFPTVIGAYGNASYTTAIDLNIRRPSPGDKGGGALGSFTISVISYTETDARKFALLSRTSATSLKYYTTGILRATDTVSDTSGFGSVTAYIGAGNYVTGVAQNNSVLECAFASLGDGLNDTQASNFYTAVQAFQTTLSRQI
jgi:hypothetical protein